MADRWSIPRRLAITLAVIAITVVTLLALVRGTTAAIPAAGNVGVMATPSVEPSVAAQSGPQIIGGRSLNGRPLDALGQPVPPRGRVVLNPVHPDENLHSLDPAVVSSAFVSQIVFEEQVLFADAALPWSYWIDPATVSMFDQTTVRNAVAVWDGLPGSRWTALFAGISDTSASEPLADGRSTIFAEPACSDLITANTYLFTDGGLGIDRYGTGTTQILEADVGICPGVDSLEVLRRAVVHEVGHVIGLAHLCDPDDGCWEPGMGEGSHECRIMFWQARQCQDGLADDDVAAVARLYPTVRPLAAPTIEQAVARVSFASTPDGSAPAVAVISDSSSASAASAAARIAASSDGPLLVIEPDQDTCLSGSGATEVNRALQRRGRLILIGNWPASCAQLAFDWDVFLRVIPDDEAEGQLNPENAQVVVTVAADAAGPALGPAVMLAADLDAALLVIDADGVSVSQQQWVASTAPSEVLVVGATAELVAGMFGGVPTTAMGPPESVAAGQDEAMYVDDDDLLLQLAAAVMAARNGLLLVPTPATIESGPGWEVGRF